VVLLASYGKHSFEDSHTFGLILYGLELSLICESPHELALTSLVIVFQTSRSKALTLQLPKNDWIEPSEMARLIRC
jgi:hypothetical protein